MQRAKAAEKFIVIAVAFRHVYEWKFWFFLLLSTARFYFLCVFIFALICCWSLKCSSSLNVCRCVRVWICIRVAVYDHFFVFMPISGNSDSNCPQFIVFMCARSKIPSFLASLISRPHLLFFSSLSPISLKHKQTRKKIKTLFNFVVNVFRKLQMSFYYCKHHYHHDHSYTAV